jgi:4-oxalomesaconate tautomerase
VSPVPEPADAATDGPTPAPARDDHAAGVRCMLMRGGTSKGAYFLRDELPRDPTARAALLLRLMGSPDPRQIDGIGGGRPLTSKVAVVAPAADDDADVEYLFLQIGVDRPLVSDSQNCGNLLAGVGPFAIERGLLAVSGDEARIRIRLLNTDDLALATFPLHAGLPRYDGATSISGVPGTAAPVRLDFADLAGGSCGALLPTGNVVDTFDGVATTCVDNGMPVVVVRARDVGVSGDESCAELEADDGLRARLERIRLQAGPAMRLGDVSDATVPKITLVAAPVAGGALSTRTFIPHRCHEAIGVLGAVSVATACLLPGSVGHGVLRRDGESPIIVLEHPSGTFEATVELSLDPAGAPIVERAGIIRTARKLMDGTVFPRPTDHPARPAGLR